MIHFIQLLERVVAEDAALVIQNKILFLATLEILDLTKFKRWKKKTQHTQHRSEGAGGNGGPDSVGLTSPDHNSPAESRGSA